MLWFAGFIRICRIGKSRERRALMMYSDRNWLDPLMVIGVAILFYGAAYGVWTACLFFRKRRIAGEGVAVPDEDATQDTSVEIPIAPAEADASGAIEPCEGEQEDSAAVDTRVKRVVVFDADGEICDSKLYPYWTSYAHRELYARSQSDIPPKLTHIGRSLTLVAEEMFQPDAPPDEAPEPEEKRFRVELFRATGVGARRTLGSWVLSDKGMEFGANHFEGHILDGNRELLIILGDRDILECEEVV
jgi:hypothetical protein